VRNVRSQRDQVEGVDDEIATIDDDTPGHQFNPTPPPPNSMKRNSWLCCAGRDEVCEEQGDVATYHVALHP